MCSFRESLRTRQYVTLLAQVFTLYQLAMQQLSKQDHYDFGLRSMVALLRYAGVKRRAYSHLPEQEVSYYIFWYQRL